MATDSTFGETRAAIEKFDGKKNFSLWQVRMRDVLVQQGTEEALNGKEDKPTGMTDKTWERMNSKAVSTIRLSLVDDVVYDVMGETSASDLWKKLEDLYMGKNFTNRLMLKQELYSLKRKEGVDLQSHIGEFNKLLCDLSNVGVKLDDEDKAIILLTSVKSTHMHLFNTLLYGRDTITVEQVKAALLSSEKMEKEDKKDMGDSQALFTNEKKKLYGKKNQGGGGGTRDRRPIKDWECYYCGEKGHLIRDCPERKKKEEERVAAFAKEEEFVENLLSITSKEKEAKEWVLDSACSSHLCSHRDWFSSYQPMEGEVFMGNGSSSKVEGVGTVKIKTTNGLTRILTNVRHVPSLRRNVISLGYLDSKGCSFAAINGLMKVRRGPRIMLMGRKVENLYVLLGNTIVDKVVAKSTKLMWKPMEKSTQKVENTVQTTSATSTISTQIEDVNPSSKAELVSFRFHDVGDVVDSLKSTSDMDLRTGFVE